MRIARVRDGVDAQLQDCWITRLEFEVAFEETGNWERETSNLHTSQPLILRCNDQDKMKSDEHRFHPNAQGYMHLTPRNQRASRNTRPRENDKQLCLLSEKERGRLRVGNGGKKEGNKVRRKRDETAQSHTTRHQIHLYFACLHAIRLPFPFQGQSQSRPLDPPSESGNGDSLP